MNLDQIKLFIRAQRDKGPLQEIVKAAQMQIEQIENPQPPRKIEIKLHKGQWYGLMPRIPGVQQNAVALGQQLPPKAILELLQTPAPSVAEFEIDKEMAQQKAQRQRDEIGWWEDEQNGLVKRRYYDVAAYDQAISKYNKRRKLISDPLCLVYRISPNGVQQINRWRDEGYEVCLPD
jgi:hypothetical protein